MNTEKPNSESGGSKRKRPYVKIVRFSKKSEPNLTTRFPGKTQIPNHYGNLTRDELSRAYVDVVDICRDLVRETRTFVPGVFFVYSENAKPKLDPLVHPVYLSDEFTPVQVDNLMNDLIRTYPPEEFTLELIMYAQEAVNETNFLKTVVFPTVVFAARDLGGATLYSAYIMTDNLQTGDKSLVETMVMGADMNEWMAPKRVSKKVTPMDELLSMLSGRYAMASSINNTFSSHSSHSTTL